MKARNTLAIAASVAAIVSSAPAQPVENAGGLHAVRCDEVRVHDEFWAPRLETNRRVTLPHVMRQCEETQRIANFEVAAGTREGGFFGYCFNDTDVYKTIEGAANVLATHRDAEIEAWCDGVIAKIGAAQGADGYLYTPRAILDPENMPPGGAERWGDLAWSHELYCAGHLYEAAVAYFEATGKRSLLDIAVRNADLLVETFGPGKNTDPPGHPEIELGLARLHGATGDARYLELMRFLIDARGRSEGGRRLYGEYAQDHAPVLEQTEPVGHAVRLGYLFAGVTDLAMLTGDRRYLDASARVWDDLVRTKLYLTGGVGSQGANEGFGEPYDLPNGSAYNETCSSIALVMWSHRLNLATGDAKYADVMERTLYNAVLAGWSASGERFFYPNPLESARGAERSPWFGCACCPPNVVRFIASAPGLMYASSDDGVVVNLYAGSDTRVEIAGTGVSISQETNYPWGGRVVVGVEPERPARFALRLRVPGWARDEVTPGDLYRFLDESSERPTLTVNGEAEALEIERGYAVIEREWRAGDRVELDLPMPIRRVVADERVGADRGRIALQQGPIVFCLEGADNPGDSVLSFVTEPGGAWFPGFESGHSMLIGSALVARRDADGSARVTESTAAAAIPYFAWANRERGSMCVWLATEAGAATPMPYPTIAHVARASSSFGGELGALADQLEPADSGDHSYPFLHWWPRKGTEEWVQYDFDQARRVAGVEVYWFDDTGRGECRLPASWRLEARVGGEWREVSGASGYGVEGDGYNRCTFEPVLAEGLRIVARAREGWAGGIHEWRVLGPDQLPSRTQPEGERPAIAPNVLPNASFEEVEGDQPRHWTRSVWRGEATQMAASDTARDGERGVGISSEGGADVAWSCTVPVEPDARYRLSGWIFTQDVAAEGNAHGALLNIHNIPEARTRALTGSNDWTYVSVEFDTGPNDAVMVNCLFGGWGLATGIACYDSIALQLLGKADAPAPSVSIDASDTGEPISEYIYGQFIEHLGRCIYGGIWAEMLEDRKFFHAAGSEESPWRAVGGAGPVGMDAGRAYVGEQCVRVRLARGESAGIEQGGLGLVEGKRYEGYVWLAGEGVEGAEISVRWGAGEHDGATVPVQRVSSEYARTTFGFTAGGTTDAGALSITARGGGSLLVGTVSLMPADNVQGFRADTLALLKELDSPVYRWPGGNFVSGYDWRDGIGERDRRPPRKNPAWLGVEHNDVGIHEFMALCGLLGTEPYIAINTGLGSVESAAEELEYLNGGRESAMGRLRAANGHPEPWGVRFIGVGNEMYGDWQLGHIPLDEYTRRHIGFVERLRAVDPTVKIVAVGAVGDWSRTMLRDCAEHMDYISEHVYWQDRPGLLSHVMQAPGSLRRTAEAHREYRRELSSLRGRDIRICEDEWNYWYGPHVFGELGTRYFMKDALGCAAALHEFGRNSDLYFMANYAQTVNVIGAIKTSPTAAAMETTGLVLQLYRRHFGEIPCATECTPTLDALAAWSADRKRLTIGIVNASTGTAEAGLSITGASLAGTGHRWEIASDDPMAFNDPDGARPVAIRESRVERLGDRLTLAPCSVTLLSLDAQ